MQENQLILFRWDRHQAFIKPRICPVYSAPCRVSGPSFGPLETFEASNFPLVSNALTNNISLFTILFLFYFNYTLETMKKSTGCSGMLLFIVLISLLPNDKWWLCGLTLRPDTFSNHSRLTDNKNTSNISKIQKMQYEKRAAAGKVW